MFRITMEGMERAGIVGRVIPDIDVAEGSSKSLMSTTYMMRREEEGRGNR